MGGRRRLIVVSNRAPVTFARKDDARVARRGAGGLVTALRSLVEHHDVTWIASAMTDEDRAVEDEAGGEAVEETSAGGSPYRLRLVTHDEAAYGLYYNVVANPTLWFAQHYLWGFAERPVLDDAFHAAWQEGYAAVNRAFARAVVAELDARPDAPVFFHDYHLYLTPGYVRHARPDATLAHFVHIPWPEPDSWSVLPLPMRRALHEGLLANDVVGFHTGRWCRNFLRSCEDVVGAEVDFGNDEVRHAGRSTLARHAPISVDPAEFARLAESDAVLEAERKIVAERPERLVVRVDRSDPSKNLVRGFRAYDAYLEAHPEIHGRVVLLALVDPSRQEIPEYAEYLAAVRRAADEVNARFADRDWAPVDLRVGDDFPGSVAAYKQFDVLFVNPIFDGLNLVAKEAPLVNERDGVVVLSENAGAHEEIGEWALTVNPFDVAAQAHALHEALSMAPEERRRRLEGIRGWVESHDIERWIEAQLACVDEVRARPGSTLEAS
ncbi:MAG TPA: trehalose-6-phosphate synthase [Gaiellaceae bacterium]